MLDHKILLELESYIREHFIVELELCHSSELLEEKSICEDIVHVELDDFIIENRKPTLQQVLFSFIDQKGIKDSEIYKKAGLDRKHFSKIRSISGYHPKKHTVVALGLALELNEEDFDQLLQSGGYSLSESETSDLVIKFCLERKIFDVRQVNEYLDYFSLKTLGGLV
ncbi:hypothetical protein KUV80_16220 [Fictibacillus nanhaiensis]|uniref:hypothetical protein n=1 Tax=Fictibacillus nanhaiensis TaxID=742169 RepID=UPI001C93D3C6|nr:hypothetical protein [Fictibacillus nanhaiensis]MBY6038207.1 hypothetical protein [Fictibacillus nanhaiensis]